MHDAEPDACADTKSEPDACAKPDAVAEPGTEPDAVAFVFASSMRNLER